MTVVVMCPNGHRFPVNPNKHINRNYRLCPHPGCNAKVIIKKRFRFLPNRNWLHQRAEETYQRTRIKQMREKESGKPPAIVLSPLDLLRASLLVKRQMEEEAKQKS